MTTTNDIPVGAGGSRQFDKLLIGLVTLGWIYALVQVLTLETPGSLAEIGPGMAIFAYVKAHLFGDPFAFESSLSFCASNTGNWSVADSFKAMAMWLGMIFAMMLPVLFATPRSVIYKNDGMSILGYVLIWVPFCAAAVALQWVFQSSGLLSSHFIVQNEALSAAILLVIATGFFYSCAYPEDPAKKPPGSMTSFRSGLMLGQRCLRCCGPLMLVMFLIGLMNVVGMLVLSFLMVALMSIRTRKLPLFLGMAALVCAAVAGSNSAGFGLAVSRLHINQADPSHLSPVPEPDADIFQAIAGPPLANPPWLRPFSRSNYPLDDLPRRKPLQTPWTRVRSAPQAQSALLVLLTAADCVA